MSELWRVSVPVLSLIVAVTVAFWVGYQRGRRVEAQEFAELAERAESTREFIHAIIARGGR